MKSYTTLRNLYGTLTNNSSTGNLTLGDQLINDSIRELLSMPYDWDFSEASNTDTTVASQAQYDFPFDYEKLKSVTVTIGNFIYTVDEAENREHFDKLNETTYTADIPEYFYIYAGKLNMFPTPSTSGNTINIYYKKRVKDLSQADYTTGTVTATNGSKAIVGAGTTFTAGMVGRSIKVDSDGFYYKIASFTDASNITLDVEYGGTTGAGEAFTIGEMPILPETFQNLPVWKAAAIYYRTKEPEKTQLYEELYNEGVNRLIAQHGSKSMNPTNKRRRMRTNPNLLVTL